MTKQAQIITALERQIQGYSDAARAKGLEPEAVQIVVRLKAALAKAKRDCEDPPDDLGEVEEES